MGRLSLIKQNHVIFLAWLPNSAGCMLPDGTFHTSPLMSNPAAPATGKRHGTRHPTRLFYIYVCWMMFSDNAWQRMHFDSFWQAKTCYFSQKGCKLLGSCPG